MNKLKNFKIKLPIFLLLGCFFSCKTIDVPPTNQPKSSSKEMTSLSIKELANLTFTVNQTNNTFTINVPFDTNIKSLTLAFSISSGASSVPKSESVQDFSKDVDYVITAEDGTKTTYKVIVVLMPKPVTKSSEKNIIDFQLTDYSSPLVGRIIEKGDFNSVIFHTVQRGPNVQSLKTKITTSPKSTVSPESLIRVDFSSSDPVYKVTAEDGTSKTYTAKLRGVEKFLPSNDLEYIVSTLDSKVFVVDSESGATIWEYNCDGELSTPTSDGKRIFVKSTSKLFAFDITSGKLLWSTSNFDIQQGLSITPILDNTKNTIFVTIINDGLYAINTSTGNRLWKYNYNNNKDIKLNNPNVTFYNNMVFSYFYDNLNEVYKLVALNSQNGVKAWEFESKLYLSGRPTIYNGKVFVGTTWKTLFALDITNGKKVWEYNDTSPAISNKTSFSYSVVFNGTLYVGFAQELLAINTDSGKLIWTSPLDNRLQTSPFVNNGKLYVNVGKSISSTYRVILYTINPSTGAKINTTNYTTGYYTNNLLVYNNIIFMRVDPYIKPVSGGAKELSSFYAIDGNDYKFCYKIIGLTPCLITKSGNVILSNPGTTY